MRGLSVLFVLLSLVTSGEASADELVCPWTTDSLADATATVKYVQIRDHGIVVRGPQKRQIFEHALEVCGEHDAATRFKSWRRWRRSTNLTLVAGLAYPPIWLASALSMSMAGVRKQQMLRQLED